MWKNKKYLRKWSINDNKRFLAPVLGSISHPDMMLLQIISIISTAKVAGVKRGYCMAVT